MRLPLVAQSYRAANLPASAQRLVNMYAEQQPNSATDPVVLLPTPGMETIAAVGSGPIRGLHTMAGVLYVVSGDGLYSVASDGTASLLGRMEGDGLVTMADVRGALVVVLQSTTPEDSKGYFYRLATDDRAALFSEITDPDFQPPSSVTALDGYFIFAVADSDQWFISGLRDAEQYDALDFATAEARPDTLVRVVSHQRRLYLFGSDTIETWYNAGGADFPFVRQQDVYANRGLAAAGSVAAVDEALCFLGDDGRVYRFGGGMEPISTHAVERAIEGADTNSCRSWSYSSSGHSFYVLWFPDQCWVWDAATNLWHERASWSRDTWRAAYGARVYDRVWIGDAASGELLTLDGGLYTDAGQPIKREAMMPPVHAESDRVFIAEIRISADAGIGLQSGQGRDPLIMLSWSNDGGRTFTGYRKAPLGAVGQYERRAVFRRLGQARNRVHRLTLTDPVPLRLGAVFAVVQRGEY